MALPIELITMGASAVFSGALTLMKNSQENQRTLFEQSMQRASATEASVQEARKVPG